MYCTDRDSPHLLLLPVPFPTGAMHESHPADSFPTRLREQKSRIIDPSMVV